MNGTAFRKATAKVTNDRHRRTTTRWLAIVECWFIAVACSGAATERPSTTGAGRARRSRPRRGRPASRRSHAPALERRHHLRAARGHLRGTAGRIRSAKARPASPSLPEWVGLPPHEGAARRVRGRSPDGSHLAFSVQNLEGPRIRGPRLRGQRRRQRPPRSSGVQLRPSSRGRPMAHASRSSMPERAATSPGSTTGGWTSTASTGGLEHRYQSPRLVLVSELDVDDTIYFSEFPHASEDVLYMFGARRDGAQSGGGHLSAFT